MTSNPKHHSSEITDGPKRAGARAMLKAIGLTDDDLARQLLAWPTPGLRRCLAITTCAA